MPFLSKSCLPCLSAEPQGRGRLLGVNSVFFSDRSAYVNRSKRGPIGKALADRPVALRRCLCPNPWSLKYVTLQGRRDFGDVIEILRWRAYAGYLGGPNKGPYKEEAGG